MLPFLVVAALAQQAAPVPERGRIIASQVTVPHVACDYGEDRPRMPGPVDSRSALIDLVVGQELRRADQEHILAVLSGRFPGEATAAFVAIARAQPYDSDASIGIFKAIIERHRESPNLDLQIEVARARRMLILAWRSRHVGLGEEGSNLRVGETYRTTKAGRRWSRLIDEFIRDYRGRGAAFDEFVAVTEYQAISRDAPDRVPGENAMDSHPPQPGVADPRAEMLRRMTALIARYGASPNERVQRIVADAMRVIAHHVSGAAPVAQDRAFIARHADARDIALRVAVDGAYERLKMDLGETGQSAELAAAEAEHAAWKAAHYDMGCGP